MTVTHTACPHGTLGCPHEVSPNHWQYCPACVADMDAAIKQAEDDLGCRGLPQPHAHPRQVKAR